jgi:hypothetical protein
VPGGSASGSASAVAQGECALGIGTDTTGSVRVPAANCGPLAEPAVADPDPDADGCDRRGSRHNGRAPRSAGVAAGARPA